MNLSWPKIPHGSIKLILRNVLIFTVAHTLFKSDRALKPFIIRSSVLLLDLGKLGRGSEK